MQYFQLIINKGGGEDGNADTYSIFITLFKWESERPTPKTIFSIKESTENLEIYINKCEKKVALDIL